MVTSVQETYPTEVPLLGLKHQNLKKASATLVEAAQITTPIPSQSSQAVRSTPFAHLHTFSQFSVLQSTIRVKELAEKAAQLDMPAVALTDMGNLMGAFHFVKSVKEVNAKLKAADDRPPLSYPYQ